VFPENGENEGGTDSEYYLGEIQIELSLDMHIS